MGRQNGDGVVAGVREDAGMGTPGPEPHSPEVNPERKSSQALSEVQVDESEKQRASDQAGVVSEAPAECTENEAPEKKFFRERRKDRDAQEEKGEVVGFGLGESLIQFR